MSDETKTTGKIIDLMEALKKSLKHKGKAAPARAHPAARKKKKAAR